MADKMYREYFEIDPKYLCRSHGGAGGTGQGQLEGVLSP